MDPDQEPPRRVPAPRDGGRDLDGDTGGEAWYPYVPAPRGAPALERLTGRAATPAAHPAPPAGALVLVPQRPLALTVHDPGVSVVLRSWARAVVRAVHVAVDGVRSLLDALVPAPASR